MRASCDLQTPDILESNALHGICEAISPPSHRKLATSVLLGFLPPQQLVGLNPGFSTHLLALANDFHILNMFPHLQTEGIYPIGLMRRLNEKVLNTSYCPPLWARCPSGYLECQV